MSCELRFALPEAHGYLLTEDEDNRTGAQTLAGLNHLVSSLTCVQVLLRQERKSDGDYCFIIF